MITASALCGSPNDGLNQIEWRLVRLPVPVLKTDFFNHVAAESANAELEYVPTYYEKKVAPGLKASLGCTVRFARLMQQMLFSLEMAAVCCICARDFPPQSRDLLEDAQLHLVVFDDIRNGRLYQKLATKEARRRGGKVAQRQRECARTRGARLILTMRPLLGWESPAHAARTIEERLVRFIRARRVPIVCEGSLRRTIVRWIHHHPAVQAAYAATCS